MAKKKSAKSKDKPASTTEPKTRHVEAGFLMMVDSASLISARDCAAYSVLNFHRGDAPEEWQQMGVEALAKFAEFGWSAFHALGGLSVDWTSAAETISEKLKLPKKA